MFEGRRALVIGALILAVVTAVIWFAVDAFTNKKDGGAPKKPAVSREDIIKKRQHVISMMGVLKKDAASKGGRFPDNAKQAEEVLIASFASLPLEPTTKRQYELRDQAPMEPHHVQFAFKSTCINGIALKETKAVTDAALLVKDELTETFCLAEEVKR